MIHLLLVYFYGENKPGDLKFLNDFVSECKELNECGISFNDRFLNFSIHAIICDSPARSFVKNIKGHAAYLACERCTTDGVWDHKMTFPDCAARKRTDVSFDELDDPEHHRGVSPLSELGIGMVSHFVIDYMHLICLGVVRRLIWLWLSGPVDIQTRLNSRIVSDISDKLLGLRDCMPVEFARKPRSLVYWQRWKATEFRTFLLYTGPVVLLGKVSSAVYNNFLLLSVGIHLLLNNHFNIPEYIDYAEQLLVSFVKHYAELYGSNMVVYNVHNVIHLADDARKYGVLDNVSAFCFENFLGKLIRLVRKPSKPLEQVVRRLLEQRKFSATDGSKSSADVFFEEHYSEGIPRGLGHCRQYKRLRMNNVLISTNKGNNCIGIAYGVFILTNIVTNNTTTLLMCQKFIDVQDFFTYPLPSSQIGIKFVSKLSNDIVVHELSEFKGKYVILPHAHGFVVVPLLHL